MNHDQARKLIDDYADGSLSADLSAEAKKHIDECRECSSMVEQIQNLLMNIRELPEKIPPPHDLWKDIFHQIHDLKVVQIKKEEPEPVQEKNVDAEEMKAKQEKKKEIIKKKEQKEIREKKRNKEKKESKKNNFLEIFKKNKTISGIAVSLIVLGIVLILIISSGGSSWQVSGLQGQYKINGRISGGELNKDDVLETLSNSAAVTGPGIGQLSLNPWSKIQKKEENVFLLLKGSFTSVKRKPEESLTAQVLGSEIQCMGASVEYKTELNDNKYAVISVSKGKIIVTRSSLESVVVPGFNCRLTENGPGIPFNIKSPDEIKKALEMLSFINDQDSFNKILSGAGLADGVSLWHLLKRINGDERGDVFNKLYSLYALPKGVDQQSILRLKEEALNSWFDQIAGLVPN